MVAVGYPWLRAVQQGSEYDSWIDADLSALLQMLIVPYSFVESAESVVCLGQSVVYFPVDLGVWCGSTLQISEQMNCFQLSSTDGDVGRGVLLWGAGWWRIAVFFKLTLSLKSWAVSAKQEVRCCRVLLVWATRTALSAKRRWRNVLPFLRIFCQIQLISF